MLCKNLDSSFTTWLTNLILESMTWKFEKNFVCIATFALSITFTYWTLVDARVKKDDHFENKKCDFGSKQHFWFSKCLAFLTRRFLYIFGCCGPWCGMLWWEKLPYFLYLQLAHFQTYWRKYVVWIEQSILNFAIEQGSLVTILKHVAGENVYTLIHNLCIISFGNSTNFRL